MHHHVFHACATASLWLPPTHTHMATSDLRAHSHLPHTHTTIFLMHVACMAASLTLPAPLWPWPSHHPSLSSPLVSPPPTIPIRLISYVMNEYGHNSPISLMLVALALTQGLLS